MQKEYLQILTDLKNKVYYPLYFLCGNEPFYIDRIADFIENNVLDDSEKEFNLSVFYGNEVNMQDVISAAKRYPMMANHQVILVKEAQNIKEKELELLIPYLENPIKSTLLVFCYKEGKLDKRKKLAKLIEKNALLFESEKIKDYKLPEWITKYVSELGCSIEPNAALLLSESIGNDLSRIHNELSKLLLNLPKGTKFNTDHIEAYIGISKEYNVFELQNAIGKREFQKAMRIVANFAQNPKENPLVLIIGSLYSLFQKLLVFQQLKNTKYDNKTIASALGIDPNPYIIKEYETMGKNYNSLKLIRIFALLRQYDAMSKGIGNNSINDSELLKELVLKIFSI